MDVVISGLESSPSKVIDQGSMKNEQLRWTTFAEHRLYSSKLLAAIRFVYRNVSSSSTPRPRAIREAADRALAVTARGRSRWSRAIIANQLKLKRRRRLVNTNTRLKKVPISVSSSWKRARPLQKNLRILGRLVPGCRKLTYPVLLEESLDYIAALQMQIKSMTALADALNASSAGVA